MRTNRYKGSLGIAVVGWFCRGIFRAKPEKYPTSPTCNGNSQGADISKFLILSFRIILRTNSQKSINMTVKIPNRPNCIESTGLCVSPLGFGCAPLGHPLFSPITDQQAIDVVHSAINQGVRLFDTAPSYGNGLSEYRLGKALMNFPREDYVLETKLGLIRDGNVFRYNQPYGSVRQSLLESLERMGVENLDILLIHDPDRDFKNAVEVIYPELAELKSAGYLKAIGVGINQWRLLEEFNQLVAFDVYMLAHSYSLLRQESLAFLNDCAQRNISIHLAGVYHSGILATGAKYGARYIYHDAPEDVCSLVCEIQTICEKYEVPIRAAAIQFAWAHPAVTSVVIGMSSPEEVYDNLGAMNMPIPNDLWSDLKEHGMISPDAPVPHS
jgi:D-threo-aldose 1-dehydrogenase